MITFEVPGIEVEQYAATPSLAIAVRITETSDEPVHTVALRCQVRIDPQRRGYSDDETASMRDLFGDRIRWNDTQRSFLWGHTSTVVPGFTGTTEVSMPFPLTYDLEVAAGKYLHAVREGRIPLTLMFSGTVFLAGPNGFQVQHIPWDADVNYLMPGKVWGDAMEAFFPHSGWVRLDRDTLDALIQVRSELGITNWDETLLALMAKARVSPS